MFSPDLNEQNQMNKFDILISLANKRKTKSEQQQQQQKKAEWKRT